MYVRDVDVASRTHVEGSVSGTTDTGNTITIALYQVPAGKRFVLQGLSVRAGGSGDPGVNGISLYNGNILYFAKAESIGLSAFNQANYIATIEVPIEAAGGSQMTVNVNRRDTTYGFGATVSFTGYLIDEPAPAP